MTENNIKGKPRLLPRDDSHTRQWDWRLDPPFRRTPGWAGQGPWVPLGTCPKLATQTHPGFDSGALRRGSRAPRWAGDRAKPSKYRKSSQLIAQTAQDDERQVSLKDPSLSVLHWQDTSGWSSAHGWTQKKRLCYIVITQHQLFCFKNSSWCARLSHGHFSSTGSRRKFTLYVSDK